MDAPRAKPAADNRLIKAIQTCRRKVSGLDAEDVWRDFLQRTGGRRSLREMTGPQLGRVLDALRAAGGAGRPRFPNTPQVQKIRALWLALAAAGAVRDRSEAAIAAFVRRQTGQEVGALPAESAHRVIEALKGWLARIERGCEPDREAPND